MLGLAGTLVGAADHAAARGDLRTARAYTRALYAVGDRFACSPAVTLDGLQIAYYFHRAGARMEARLAANDNAPRSRSGALREFWEDRIAPELAAFEQTVRQEGDMGEEETLAARLAAAYRDGWARVQAGEA